MRAVPHAADHPREIVTDSGEHLVIPGSMTLTEFEAYPFPEGDHWELLAGCTVHSASPRPRHQVLLLRVCELLEHSRPDLTVIPGIDVRLPEQESCVCPDISLVAEYRADELPLAIIPVLVVEILSPGSQARDVGVKRELYLAAGVREYWTVDPVTAYLTIHHREAPAEGEGGEYAVSPPDLDGFCRSPVLECSVRVRLGQDRYEVESR
jgi:Uma2 family endonuclease